MATDTYAVQVLDSMGRWITRSHHLSASAAAGAGSELGLGVKRWRVAYVPHGVIAMVGEPSPLTAAGVREIERFGASIIGEPSPYA